MKNKGIAIELTALLDVILIMLFWVMMSMERQSENVRADAEEQIAASKKKYEDMYESMYESMSAELEEKQATIDKYESRDTESVAAANQKALDEFAEGRIITLNLSYDAVGTLVALGEDGEIGHTLISDRRDIAEKISGYLTDAGLGEDDVILCALVYDGDRALYDDLNVIKDAAGDVAKTYGNFYCTYINISR